MPCWMAAPPVRAEGFSGMQAPIERHPVPLSLFNGGIYVTATDGMAIADSPRSAERLGVNYMDRDYILGALRDGKSTIGQPVMGKKALAPVFVMTAPIRDARGAIIGAVAGVTNLGAPSFLDQITFPLRLWSRSTPTEPWPVPCFQAFRSR